MADTNLNAKVREELSSIKPQNKYEAVSELSGLIRSGGVLTISKGMIAVSVSTKSDALVSHVRALSLVARTASPSVSGEKVKTVVFDKDPENLLIQLGIFNVSSGEMKFSSGPPQNLIKTDAEKRAFVRGAFLGSGFVSIGKNRHLEIVFSGEELRDGIKNILDEVPINVSTGMRDGEYTVYLKGKEKISEMLTFMGAQNAALDVIGEMVRGDVIKRVTAANNCDMANIEKTVATAASQIAAIKKIDETVGLDALEVKLKTTALLRLGYPEASLSELAGLLGVSKSCVKHRLDKIVAYPC